jgi:glycosyltransferase involved in cell wall biosynthesis
VKVALVIGECPPGKCGVGDYTRRLHVALNSIGVESLLVTSGNWNLSGVFSANKRLRQQKFDIIHLEYPTIAFHYALSPQALSLLGDCVITIHEASQRHILRKLALIPFAIRPEHIIFTSGPEQQFATKWAPWIARRSSVVPVGSNVATIARISPRNLSEVVYFGLISPRKDLEQVFELAALIKAAELPLMVRIVGGVPVKHLAYFEQLRLKSLGLPVIWDRDLSDEQVAERLAGTSIAYLPYWDGASERRTTLKAALQSGMAVITTRGRHTPENLLTAVRFSRNPEDALAQILSLIANSEETSRLRANAMQYAQQYSWESIAKSHLEVYQSVLNSRSSNHMVPAEGKSHLLPS